MGWLIQALLKLTINDIWGRMMTETRLDDPVYKKNVERLIERNRKFEESRNEPHS